MSLSRRSLWRWARNIAIAGFVAILFFIFIHTPPARNLVASLVATTAAWLLDMEVSIGSLDYRLWRGEARVAGLRLVSETGEALFQLDVSDLGLDLSSSFDLSVELTRPQFNLSIRESPESTGDGEMSLPLPSYLPDIKILEGGILVESDVGARIAVDAFELQAENGLDAYEATAQIPEAIVQLGDHEVSLGPVRADLVLKDDRLVIKSLELRSGSSHLEARGSLETSSGLDGVLDIDYELDESLIEGLLSDEGLRGSVSGQAHIELADGHFRATSSFPGTVVFYGDARVDIDGRLEYADDEVHVQPLTVRAYDGRAELEARLDLRDGGRQEFRGRCDGLDVVTLANDFLEEDLPLASLAQVEGELVLEDWSLDGADVRAEVEFYPQRRQGMLPVGGTLVLNGAVDDLQFRARLDSDTFGSELNLAGRLADGNLNAEYEVRVNDLAGPELGFIPTKMDGRLSASGELSGTLLEPIWTTTIESSNLQIGGAPFRLAAEAAGSVERARLDSLTLEATEGRLAAQGEILFDSPSSWDLELEVTDLPIEPLVDRLDIPLSGKIDARGKLFGLATNPDWSFSVELDELPGQAELELEKKGSRIALTELRAFNENGFLEGAGAYLLDSESVELRLDWRDLSLSRVLGFATDIEGLEGRLSGALEVNGPWRAPKGRASLDLHDALLFGHELAAFALTLESDGEALELELLREGSPLARGSGRLQDPYPLHVGVDLALLPLSELFQGLAGLQVGVTAGGQLDIDLAAATFDELTYRARVEQFEMELPERRAQASPFTIEGDLESVRIRDLELSTQAGKLAVAGVVPLQEEGRFDLTVSGEIGLNALEALVPEIDTNGQAHMDGKVTGTLAAPEPVGQIEIIGATGSWEGFDWNDFNLQASAEGGRLELQSARGGFLGGEVELRGSIPVSISDTAESGRLEIVLEGIDLGHLVPAEFEVRPKLVLDARGVVHGSGMGIEHLDGSGEISRLVAGVGRYQIQNPETIPWHLEAGAFSIPRLRLSGNETDVTLGLGPFQIGEEISWEASIEGILENAFLNPFLSTVPGMQISGTSQLDFRMSDGPEGFAVDGRGEVRGGRFVIPEPPLVLSNLGGTLAFDGTQVKLSGFTAGLGGGSLVGEGIVDLSEPGNPEVNFEMTADELSLQVMEGLRGRFAGSVRFRGRPGDFLLSGNLRMLQGLMDKEVESDANAGGSRDLLLAGPTIEESFADRVSLDILFNTERDLRIENSMVRLEASGNLSLSGTLASPELSGTFRAKQDGTFQVGRNSFQLVSGRVDIDGYPLSSPDILVSALTRVGNTLIRLDADGDIDDLRTRLSAPDEPSLTEGDLMSLLVTGRTLENAAEGGQQMATSWAMSSAADMLHEGWGKAFSFGGPPSGAGPITLSEEKDPTSRFTVGMPITDDLSLTYSIALDETESQLWILDYQVARNLWLRAIQENSSQYTLGFSHRLELDWTRSPYEASGGRAATEIVANVSLEGQIPPSGGALLQSARLKPGDRYDYWVAREDAARMEASLVREGYRSAVVDVEGRPYEDELALIFLVEAGPPTEVVWEGEDLGIDFKKKIDSAWNGRIPEEFLIPDLATRATRELRANRYYSARVDANVNETESGQQVVFHVNRGPRGSKVVLEFTGNETLTDSALAGALPPTTTVAFFSLLDKPSELEKGLRLRYASEGYLDASIGDVETKFDPTSQEFRVTIPVSEGVLSPVLEVAFEGAEAISDAKLRDTVRLREGQPFSMSEVRQYQTELRTVYREEGFPDVRIKSVMERMPEGIGVTLRVEEGHRVRVGRVRIVGQHKTKDWVVLRELTFKEGDALRISELQRSQKRLFDLGIFRSADVRAESESRGREVQDVLVQVVEQADMDVNYGLRYNFKTSDETSTTQLRAEGLEGHVRARLINALGRGSNLTLAAFVRGDGDLFRVSYQVPRFLGWRIPTQLYFEREVDIRQDDLDIALDEWNVSLQQTRRLEEGVSAFRDKLSLQWNFSFGRFVLAEGDAFTSEEVSVEEAAFHKEFRTVLGLSLIEDRRDSIANPTRGRFANVTFQVSPKILGSDTAYLRLYGQLFYFYPIRDNLIWASSYRLGLAAGSEEFLFIDNRFSAGGANSVRGFEQNTLGPFVDVDETRVYVGGQAVAVMNQELRFPIYKSLHGGAYYDVGNVYPIVKDLSLDDLRHSLGAGLRFVLPVGAIRFDWARVLNPQPEDRLNRFHFSFGYAF